ncbi:MAG TPA: nicotinamidase [Gemmatimonadaceae bacterium]
MSERPRYPRGGQALLVVDVQNDFCPGGALAVSSGDEIVPILNRYIKMFERGHLPIYLSRDWHPRETRHFREFGGRWPAHCVQESVGAAFHPALAIPADAQVISKGTSPDDEGYSAFDGRDATGTSLADSLVRYGARTLYVAGLATEYCVRASVLDAIAHGLRVVLLVDAIRPLDPDDGLRAIDEMRLAGARVATLDEVGRAIDDPSMLTEARSAP